MKALLRLFIKYLEHLEFSNCCRKLLSSLTKLHFLVF